MQFGLLYEHQSPALFNAAKDRAMFQNALDEFELAEKAASLP